MRAGLALLGALALAANGVLAVLNVQAMDEAQAAIGRSTRILDAEQDLLLALSDAEAGQRGFLLTGRPEYLEPWRTAREAVSRHLDDLEQLTAAEQGERPRVRMVRPVVEAKLAELDRTVAIASGPGGAEAARAVVRAGQGKALMDQARALLGGLAAGEARIVAERRETSRVASRRTVTAHVVTLAASFVLLSAALALARSRRRAVERAAAQEHRYRLVAAHSRDLILFMRRDGRIVEANAAAERAYGYAPEALRRLRVQDLRAPATSPLTAEQMAKADEAGILFETVHRRADGSTFPVEVSSQGADVDGERMLISVVRDISARQAAARALRQSEAHLRLLAEALPQLVWTAAADGTRDYFNQRWRDYTGQAAGAEAWEPVLHPDDQERVLAVWREAVVSRRPFELEHRLRRHDGEYRWFLRRAIFLHGGEPGQGGAGERSRWFGTCTDIHELKTSEEVLRKADRLKQDFLSMASHEFRTPLTALRLQVEMLHRRLGDRPDERILRNVTAIEAQLARLDDLLAILLDVARINEGKLSLQVASVDLGEIARDAVERLRPVAEDAGSAVHVSAREVRGSWDRARLDQAVTNLLTNAIKYGNAKPVEVEVAELDGSAILAVKDRGIGIPPENRAHLFEQFERGANADRAHGLGLGLWITKKMVDAHGGRITVESTPGAGSTFTVILPRGPRA